MPTDSTKRPIRPWQTPVLESPEERSRREQRESQTRYFVDCIKQAIRELSEEHSEGDGDDLFSRLFK